MLHIPLKCLVFQYETLALPSEKAVAIALRTQQLLAYETGVANVVVAEQI